MIKKQNKLPATVDEIRENQDKIFSEFEYIKNSLHIVLENLESVREKKKILMSEITMCDLRHTHTIDVLACEVKQLKDDVECVQAEIDDIKIRIDKMAGLNG